MRVPRLVIYRRGGCDHSSSGGSGTRPQEPSSQAVEIAAAEMQADAIEAVARIATLAPVSSDRMAGLGKALFYDKALSAQRNEACAFCHMP